MTIRRRGLSVLAMVLVVLQALAPVPAGARLGYGLDLPWIVLDAAVVQEELLADAPILESGWSWDAFMYPEGTIELYAARLGGGNAAVETILEDHRFQGEYVSRNSFRLAGDRYVTVDVYVEQFMSAKGAAAAFPMLQDEQAPGWDDLPVDEVIGEATDINEVPVTDMTDKGLELSFLRDRLIVRVMAVSQDPDHAPGIDGVATLASMLVERVDAVLAGTTPGLGLATVDLRYGAGVFAPAEATPMHRYHVLDGVYQPWLGETTASIEQGAERRGPAISEYAVEQWFAAERDGEPSYYAIVTATRYADEATAESALARTVGLEGEGGRVSGVDFPAAFGEGAALFEESDNATLIFRQGNVVHTVILSSFVHTTPDPFALIPIGEVAIGCFESVGQDCRGIAIDAAAFGG